MSHHWKTKGRREGPEGSWEVRGDTRGWYLDLSPSALLGLLVLHHALAQVGVVGQLVEE